MSSPKASGGGLPPGRGCESFLVAGFSGPLVEREGVRKAQWRTTIDYLC
jgi:hypothetical protein